MVLHAFQAQPLKLPVFEDCQLLLTEATSIIIWMGDDRVSGISDFTFCDNCALKISIMVLLMLEGDGIHSSIITYNRGSDLSISSLNTRARFTALFLLVLMLVPSH